MDQCPQCVMSLFTSAHRNKAYLPKQKAVRFVRRAYSSPCLVAVHSIKFSKLSYDSPHLKVAKKPYSLVIPALVGGDAEPACTVFVAEQSDSSQLISFD